ncbi:ATP-binding region ATPase domain protein [Pedobacter heparinus DSM 2366]|uniref:histidine kinase n=1 Tax=Pedobacter heparinus (strain ATCC 13125 / DSM 2366 / CIP 104194 / JCM 7457 / NBRC 12017 / NCIMB 9290 / NRRL B-14731 / HIM 762-3) TaxID=485917 RepID=C6Y1N9_PEDHD|nr:ATP-binding region ATPase domain protein [Pedobacter heparinus DSM 2366]
MLAGVHLANAQTGGKQFRNISVDKGLSQSTVFAIRQDTLGFIWVGTQDGLNRYDSKNFKVYRPVRGENRSLQSYYIRCLFTDHTGSLWVGGNQGISRYDYKTDSFVNYKLPRSVGEWYICSMTEDAERNIWAVSIAGDIFRLRPSEKKFIPINLNTLPKGIRNISYIGIWKNDLLLGTDIGLFKVSDKRNDVVQIKLGIDKPGVNDVFIDNDDWWIATEGYGLLRYNVNDKLSKSYVHIASKNSIIDNNIRSIDKDADGNIWLGTFKGLSILDPVNLTFDNYYHQISQPFTIGQNSVRCIYRDRQKGMWLGTYYGGVSYYHKDDIKFNLLSQNIGKPSLNDEVISVIKQDKTGDFWIGTNNKGVNRWNKSTNTISYYTSNENDPNSLSSNNIKAIAFDHMGNVLIGTHKGGLNVLNSSNGRIKRYLHDENDPSSIAGNLVYSILKDYKGRIWIGTRSGLDLFQPEAQKFMHVFSDKAGKRLISNDITCLFEDSKHRIWIGTTNGVSQFYPDNLLFGNIGDGSLSEDIVNCITEDKKKRIWMGTRDGLSLFDEAKRSFVPFKNESIFLTGTIYGIQPDDEGNLWISTNSGLVKFNPDHRLSLQAFDESDGLQNNQFNEYSFCKANDGLLLFGGIKGISYFYPSALKQQPLSLRLRFTALEVFDKTVAANDETDILSNHIDQTKELELNPEYKQFSISFNTFNFVSSNRTHYEYKLEGIDKTWQDTEALKISYSNLPYGDYELYVKAIGPNGETSPVRSLKISVLPPWYKTSWFYLLMSLLTATAGYIIYREVSERVRALHQLKLERLDKEKVRYINQVKMDFFTNVSHELRTPLTLILAPLEELIKIPLADKVSKKLNLMSVNAKRLYSLVDQLFEFRKTEMGTRPLKVAKGDIVSFIFEIYESFKPLSEKNNIHYTYHSTEAKLSFYFDKDAMEKILFNLLSNAFKYTSPHHKVSIELLKKDDVVLIKIADTGIGINEEDLTKVFDRFYQVDNREMNLGSGVGLAFTKRLVELHHGQIRVESEPGRGSTFTINIPMSDEVYDQDLHAAESPVYELSIVPENEGTDLDNSFWEHEVLEEETELQDKELKLLLVDDNKEILAYLQDFFDQTYQISVAFDGKMALEMLAHQQFDMIISDVMMPELDGLHFCKRVKQNINTSHIPLILLTAKTEDSQLIKGLEMGADDYVTKPFSTSLLAAKITNLLRSRKRLKEYYSTSKEIVPENIAFNAIDEEFLKQAIAIVERYLSDSEFSVDKFSREVGMSRSNLYLKLKAITGESVKDFVRRIRFKKAVELMLSKKYTLAQIAYSCGFNTPSYFSTSFKQYYGVMPSDYLAKIEAEKQ